MRLFATARRSLPQLVPLFKHQHVPAWLKTITVMAALLIVSPLDIFSDIPVLGIFDDVALLALLLNFFVLLAGGFALRASQAESAQPGTAVRDMRRARPARVVGPAALNR